MADPEDNENTGTMYEPDDPDGWRPYCDDEMGSYDGEADPDGCHT